MNMPKKSLPLGFFLLLGVTATVWPRELANAQSAPFYQGKTMRIIVGFTPGGLYDQYARLLARYMGKHIPGNPNIIVQNMPGAGSIIATNYVSNVVKPDGLTFGMIGSGIY